MIRLSVGIVHVEDILNDLSQAFDKVKHLAVNHGETPDQETGKKSLLNRIFKS